jgi:cell division protein ZapA (FtsZ GTPase activity inhibitor)
MNTLNEISIKVNIADRTYPLTIAASQEEQVRKAAKMINDKMKALQQTFAVKDKQDILSMIALEAAVSLVSKEEELLTQQTETNTHIMDIAGLLSHIQI